eukprot:6014133-Ditylum_brightwellii.AAC.1
MERVMIAAMVKFRVVYHILLILPRISLVRKKVTAAMAEVGGGHHRLLIQICVCLVWKVVNSLMVELQAGCDILFILPGVQE